MSKSSSSKRGRFWRADWLVGAAVVAAVLLLHYTSDTINTLEVGRALARPLS